MAHRVLGALVCLLLCAGAANALVGVPTRFFCATCSRIVRPMATRMERYADLILNYCNTFYEVCLASEGGTETYCSRILPCADVAAYTSKVTPAVYARLCHAIEECDNEDYDEEEGKEVDALLAGDTTGEMGCNLCLRYFQFIYKTYTVDTLLKSLSDLQGPLCDTIMFRQRTDCYKSLQFFVESIRGINPRITCKFLEWCQGSAGAAA